MGKSLIRVESMDMDEKLDRRYADGIEADGFAIIADREDDTSVAVHGMSIDMLSDAFAHNDQLLSAGILAKAKYDIVKLNMRKAASKLSELFAGLGESDD